MRTTAAHFKIFKAECEKWIKVWGLLEWKIYYDHLELDGDYGECCRNLIAKKATIALGKTWANINAIGSQEVKAIAFHEVAELLLSGLDILAMARFTTANEIESERHSIIQRLENVVFEGSK